MTPIRTVPLAAALALALAACSPSAESPAPAPEAPETTGDVAADAPAPAPADDAAPDTPVASPAADGPVYDETVINFGGYKSAPFNSDADALRAAFDGPLHAIPEPESADACHYLLPGSMGADGYATGFMFEGGKFVRVDVDTDDLVAPGGLTVGMTADDVRRAFPAVEEQPHKYTDGKYLVVKPADGGEGRLVFEVDADGRITEWRIGLEPQVHYVEGCS